jgi:hypothetical protein
MQYLNLIGLVGERERERENSVSFSAQEHTIRLYEHIVDDGYLQARKRVLTRKMNQANLILDFQLPEL